MRAIAPVVVSGTIGRMTLEGCRGHLGNKMSVVEEAQSLKSPNLSQHLNLSPHLSLCPNCPSCHLSPGDKIVTWGQRDKFGDKLSRHPHPLSAVDRMSPATLLSLGDNFVPYGQYSRVLSVCPSPVSPNLSLSIGTNL